MEFERAKATILNQLLEHKGLQALIDTGAALLGNPVFVCDLSTTVMVKSHVGSAGSIDAAFWDDVASDEGLLAGNAQLLEESGVFGRIFDRDEPAVGEYPFLPWKLLGARLRDRNDVVGLMTVVGVEPFGERDGELLVVLCQAFVLEAIYQENRSSVSSALLNFISRAIDGKDSRSFLVSLAGSTKPCPPEPCQVLVAELPDRRSSLSLGFARTRLAAQLPGAPSEVYHDRLVVLSDGSRPVERMAEAVASAFDRDGLVIGAGRTVACAADLGDSYRQARSAMDIGRSLGLRDKLFCYDDFCVEDFIARAARVVDLEPFCEPSVARMEQADAREGSHLLRTLEVYLQSANNAQAAARILGIHKNTMYARLRRIEKDYALDLSSGSTCFSLSCTLRMRAAMRANAEG